MIHTFGVEFNMKTPPGWELVEERLMHERSFDDFVQSKSFVDAVSELCEKVNHHADIHFGWGYVVIEVTTHDVGAVTQKDIDLALAINQL